MTHNWIGALGALTARIDAPRVETAGAKEHVTTVIEVGSSSKTADGTNTQVASRDHGYYVESGALTLTIAIETGDRTAAAADLHIRPQDVLRLSRLLHRAGARAERLGWRRPGRDNGEV